MGNFKFKILWSFTTFFLNFVPCMADNWLANYYSIMMNYFRYFFCHTMGASSLVRRILLNFLDTMRVKDIRSWIRKDAHDTCTKQLWEVESHPEQSPVHCSCNSLKDRSLSLPFTSAIYSFSRLVNCSASVPATWLSHSKFLMDPWLFAFWTRLYIMDLCEKSV